MRCNAQVVLEEINHEVLRDVLTYLYTDAVRIAPDNSFELFMVRKTIRSDCCYCCCCACLHAAVSVCLSV